MYKVDPILLEKFQSMHQTRANNNDPNPLVYITRNRTPITTQRFWEKLRVTSTVGTRSSIAVRRPEGNLTGDMIFVAQVENGNAIIRKAEPRINLTDMVWSHVTTINNVSELSIMFDGYMKMVEGKVESYTTGNLPIVFYVDSDNSLKGWNMNNDIQFTISDTAYNVASVRGLYSEAADLNDGIFVFYTNASGELWEARVLNDEVTELTQITMKPEGVTGWEDVWASLTFDYRVVLQLKGNNGGVHTLISYSRPSGYSNIEYLSLVKASATGKCGFIPPNILGAKALEVNYTPSKIIIVKFDGIVQNVGSFDIGNIKLISNYGDEQKEYSPYLITQGINKTEAILHFNDLTELVESIHLVGTNMTMGSINLGVDDFDIELNIFETTGTYGIADYLAITSAESTGELLKAFDGKAYSEDEYVTIINATASGTLYALIFAKGYVAEECVIITAATATGVLCDTNNIPL